MYAVSDRWEQAVKNSGPRIARVDIYDNWSTGSSQMVNRLTLLADDVYVSEFSITVNRNADIRRTATITVVDQDIYDMIAAFSPNPLGWEFYISMGVRYEVDNEEVVPMGVFMIDEYSFVDGTYAVEFNLVDRMRRFDFFAAKSVYDTSVAGQIIFDDIVEDFIWNASYANFITGATGPVVNVDSAAPGAVAPSMTASVYEVADPLAFFKKLKTSNASYSFEYYFDTNGDFYITTLKTITTADDENDAVFIFRPGAVGGKAKTEVELLLNGMTNRVFLGPGLKESTSAIVSGTANISDSADPLRTTGPAGNRTKAYDVTSGDAEGNLTTMATNRLVETMGVERRIDIEALANPALEAGDIIGIELSDGTVALQLIESVTVNSNWVMTLETTGQRFS